MKTKSTFLIIAIVFLNNGFSQSSNLERSFAPIETELQTWDPVRGEWLSKSLLAIAQNTPVPDRMFPENFTPYEMVTILPNTTKQKIREISTKERESSANHATDFKIWNSILEILNRQQCEVRTGRTHGDPHFYSFDGNSFDLQSVGEFVLAKSKDGKFEVQTRQLPSGDSFSLNSAVAMNVGGDRLCIYAKDLPDTDNSSKVRLNGRSIFVDNGIYFLPHGGTVSLKNRSYTITWPTGEKVIAQLSGEFMNVSTSIYPCVMGGFQGLLGNANGNPRDDMKIDDRNNNDDLYASMDQLNTIFSNSTFSQNTNDAERQYQDRLTRNFGFHWRVTDQTTLFDYPNGKNTASFTDLSFPTLHRTIGDLNQTQRDNARRECERQGIGGINLRGCIYDYAYLNIPPAPQPVFTDNTSGVVVNRIPPGEGRPNINKPIKVEEKPSIPVEGKPELLKENPSPKGENSKPIETDVPVKKEESPKASEKPESKVDSKPVYTTSPALEKEEQKQNPNVINTVFGKETDNSSPAPISKPTVSKPAPIVLPKPASPKPSQPASKPSTPSPKPSVPASKPSVPAAPVKLPSPSKKGG
jgi:hypothetical protein